MGKIIAVANQKGGVGKTTTAVNLSAAMGERGHKTLLVDIDPQGNASSGVGIDRRSVPKSTYELLIGEAGAKEALVQTQFPNLTILPSSLNLAGAELELVDFDHREARLKTALAPLREEYEYLFIDCPPSLGMITTNALCAADTLLVPIQCEYYALEGLSQQVVEEVKKYFPRKVFRSVIPRSVRLSEAPSYGVPIMYFDKSNRGTEAYRSLAEELEKNNR